LFRHNSKYIFKTIFMKIVNLLNFHFHESDSNKEIEDGYQGNSSEPVY